MGQGGCGAAAPTDLVKREAHRPTHVVSTGITLLMCLRGGKRARQTVLLWRWRQRCTVLVDGAAVSLGLGGDLT